MSEVEPAIRAGLLTAILAWLDADGAQEAVEAEMPGMWGPLAQSAIDATEAMRQMGADEDELMVAAAAAGLLIGAHVQRARHEGM